MQQTIVPGASQVYLARREAQERAIAARTGDAMARHIHLEMADRYAALARTPQTSAA